MPDQQTLGVHFDFNNMMEFRVGAGLGVSCDQIEAMSSQGAGAHRTIQEGRRAGTLEWCDLPYRSETADEIAAVAARVSDHCRDFVVLGIGGSALGAVALHQAINHPYYNLLPAHERGPRMFFLDNVDADLNGSLLEVLDPADTVFNVVTKSGGTPETMAQFLIVRELLKKRLGNRFVQHIVVTTDPRKGILRQIADAEGYVAMDVPPGVGGRFSVLSPVGLLPAAVSGIDVGELLAGARHADELCRPEEVWRNPASMNALLQFIAYRDLGRRIVVMMPYSQALLGVADWFRQLWAESLGKKLTKTGREVRVGPTPVLALGTTDQHSQVQLYVEGPRDKVLNFLAVERWRRDIDIPSPQEPDLSYLGGHSLAELMTAERVATELAVTEAGQANCSFIIPEVNAFTVGQLLFMLELQTAYAGELFEVNAFDQPGVEAGKIATYALLGRQGYERERGRIESSCAERDPKFII